MTTSRVAELTTVSGHAGRRRRPWCSRPLRRLVVGRRESRAALDAAGLDEQREAVLVVLGLEPLDLGGDLGIDVLAARAATLRHSSM